MVQKLKYKQRLSNAQKLSIGLDIWTKKGLTTSFLALSACYYNPEANKAEYILLNLKQLAHPHTAHIISSLVEKCTAEWGIPKDKIITIITDNGSNMVAAFSHKNQDYMEDPSSLEDSDSLHKSDEEEENLDDQSLERSVCMHNVCCG